MKYTVLTESDISFLKSVVGEERISRGQSNLELHSVDETRYRGFLPDVVVWPKTTEEVSRILKMANERRIPVTPWGAEPASKGTRFRFTKVLSSISSRWTRS